LRNLKAAAISPARLKFVLFHSPWLYTMQRCAHGASRRRLLASFATALLAALPVAAANAQALLRRFPRTALRGEIGFGNWPQVTVNGQPAQLSPGSRVRDLRNMVALHGAIQGNKYVVNFTIDPMGLVHEVWILRPDEIAVQPWPRTLAEAQTWAFDESAQTWSKP
jgi:hypothetical protein